MRLTALHLLCGRKNRAVTVSDPVGLSEARNSHKYIEGHRYEANTLGLGSPYDYDVHALAVCLPMKRPDAKYATIHTTLNTTFDVLGKRARYEYTSPFKI